MNVVPSVLYRLSLPDPKSHLCHVEVRIRVSPDQGSSIDLAMACWSPGSYLIRDYPRYVRQVQAHDERGKPLAVAKIRKDCWQVDRQNAAEVVVRYQVYGNDLSVRTNHIDDSHAFLHGPATYLYVEAWRERPCRIEIAGPPDRDWHIATGLEVDGNGFWATNVDILLDCPIHLGPGPIHEFEAAAVPMRLAMWGQLEAGGVADDAQLVRDLADIIATYAECFAGEVPCRHYTFILLLAPNKYGGLEHRNSSANLHSPFATADRRSYDGLLELLSHEFFHVWNGKRIYPQAHAPFDYSRESYSRCLWVIEGITSYVDRHVVLCAGKQTAKRYLEKLAEEWGQYLSTPGRKVHSLEEASFDAWIKLYKPDEFNVNSTVSYYLKGSLVAMALDLRIRRQSNGDRSLYDLLRWLWSEYGAPGRPYPEAVQPLFEAAMGLDLEEFFARYVRGTDDPDLDEELGYVGLTLRTVHPSEASPDDREAAWLGVWLRNGSRYVRRVIDGGPAAQAGISPGDALIAIDGWQIDTDADLKKRLASRTPDDTVEVALFRHSRLIQVSVRLAAAPPHRIEIAGVPHPSAEHRQAFADWLLADHPGPGVTATAHVRRWI